MLSLLIQRITSLDVKFRIMATHFGTDSFTVKLMSIYSKRDDRTEQILNWRDIKIKPEDLIRLRDSKGKRISIELSYLDRDSNKYQEPITEFVVASTDLLEDLQKIEL